MDGELRWEQERQWGGMCWRMVRKESTRGSEHRGLQPRHQRFSQPVFHVS